MPRELFDAARYEGSDADERRLFYVAMTRARDWLSVSRHERVTKQRGRRRARTSSELADHAGRPGRRSQLPDDRGGAAAATTTDSSSPSASWPRSSTARMAYRLRNLLGFQPRLAPELGYGKAVHHVLRDGRRAHPRRPATSRRRARSTRILDASFFLPTANKPAHRQLKDAARRLVDTLRRRPRRRPAPRVGDRAAVRAAPRRRHRQRPRRRDPRPGGRRADRRSPSSTTRPRPAATHDHAPPAAGLRRRRPPRGPRRAAAPTCTTSRPPTGTRRRDRRRDSQPPRRSSPTPPRAPRARLHAQPRHPLPPLRGPHDLQSSRRMTDLPDEAESPDSDAHGRVLRLLDFLAAYDASKNPPVHDIATYGLYLLRSADLPDVDGVRLTPSADTWLTVDFVDLPAKPVVPADLEPVLGPAAVLTAKTRPTIELPDEPTETDLDLALQAEDWLLQTWQPWADRYHAAEAAKALHRDLFEQRARLAVDRESVDSSGVSAGCAGHRRARPPSITHCCRYPSRSTSTPPPTSYACDRPVRSKPRPCSWPTSRSMTVWGSTPSVRGCSRSTRRPTRGTTAPPTTSPVGWCAPSTTTASSPVKATRRPAPRTRTTPGSSSCDGDVPTTRASWTRCAAGTRPTSIRPTRYGPSSSTRPPSWSRAPTETGHRRRPRRFQSPCCCRYRPMPNSNGS